MAVGSGYAKTNGWFSVWCPTAMTLDAEAQVANVAARTATNCYMRGLSEHVRIQTSSGAPWFHRRICITNKGPNNYNTASTLDTPLFPWQPYLDTSNGIERRWQNMNINNQGNQLGSLWNLLFKGVNGQDWNDLITAPVDTARNTLKFDKTWTIQSGNERGVVKERKLWHPMNHNLVYGDDEAGEQQSATFFSTTAKPGMGDYFVIDIINPGTGNTDTDVIEIGSTSSMYWHER